MTIVQTKIGDLEFITVEVPVTITLEEFNAAFVDSGLDAPDPITWLESGGIQRIGEMTSANIYEDLKFFAELDAELEEGFE